MKRRKRFDWQGRWTETSIILCSSWPAVTSTAQSVACSWASWQPIQVCKGEQWGGEMGVKLSMNLTLARTKDSAGAPVSGRSSSLFFFLFVNLENREIWILIKII